MQVDAPSQDDATAMLQRLAMLELRVALLEATGAGTAVVDGVASASNTALSPIEHGGRTIGELVRKRRLDLGHTQEDLEDVLKVNQSTIAKWERGDRPARDKLQRIAGFVGQPVSTIEQLFLAMPSKRTTSKQRATPDDALDEIWVRPVRGWREPVANMPHRCADCSRVVPVGQKYVTHHAVKLCYPCAAVRSSEVVASDESTARSRYSEMREYVKRVMDERQDSCV